MEVAPRPSPALVRHELLTRPPMAPTPTPSDRLDDIAARYDPSNPAEQFDYHLKRLQVATASPWLFGRRVLELGCATGELTSLLAPLTSEYHVVEGSERNITRARARVPEARFIHALWEEFAPQDTFSDIVLFNALEHVAEPVLLLTRVRTWLAGDGRVHVVVPNAHSLHRLVGVEMGLQEDPEALTEGDLAQGHVRNYTTETLLRDLGASGLRPLHREGIFLKVLPNREMLGWSTERIEAMHRLARRFPEHAAELYVVATPA
jgi:SAM-dependent methyltransferase